MNAGIRKPLVVVIDDDTQVLYALRIVLQRQYQVETCAKPDEGVEVVARVHPDVVVVDIKMPLHDGFWVYREIRKHNEHVPIIFNSAYQEAMDTDDALASYRPFAYLAKGSARDFLVKVEEAVRWYAANRPEA